MVELFAARFRQEDGFRDLKQRLGWEECRAWTRNPIERTSQAQWVTMSLLRLLQFRLDAEGRWTGGRRRPGTGRSTPPNNWLAIFGGGAWAWEPRRFQYYLHNFLAEQPDFNFQQSRGAGLAALDDAVLAGARR